MYKVRGYAFESLEQAQIAQKEVEKILESAMENVNTFASLGGILAPGSDADLVVYDPAADKTITAGTQLSAAGYTPYEGWRTKGSIAQVYLRGTLAVDHGEMKAGPIGTYIPRHPGAL